MSPDRNADDQRYLDELTDDVASELEGISAAPTTGASENLPDIHKTIQEVVPEIEIVADLEKFEGKQNEGIKQQYDPLHNFLREKVGVDPQSYNLSYRTVKELRFSRQNKDEATSCNPIHFSNYTDLLQYRRSLTEEQRDEFDSYSWNDANGSNWSGSTVFADNKFWTELDDENSKLYPHREQIRELVNRLENEEEQDAFAKAVATGEVKVESKASVWQRIAALKEKLPSFGRKKENGEKPLMDELKPEDQAKPESKSKPKGKRIRGDVAKQLAYDVGWRTVGTVLGVKFIGDVGLAFAGRGDVYEATRGKKVKAERVSSQTAVKEFLQEYRKGDKNIIHDKAKVLAESIKNAKYLSPSERKTYRTQVADIIKKYHKDSGDLDSKRDRQIDKAAELYFQKKISTARVVGDALNTAFTLGGVPMLRGAGYAAGAVAERWRKSGIEFEKEKLKRLTSKEDPAVKRSKRESKGGHQFKDLIIGSTIETVRGATGFKKSANSTTRFRDALEAWGSIARFAGLAGVTVSELSHHSVQEGFAKMIEAYKENGTTQVLDNFHINFDRTIDGYRELPTRLWHGVSQVFDRGGSQAIPKEAIVLHAPEAPVQKGGEILHTQAEVGNKSIAGAPEDSIGGSHRVAESHEALAGKSSTAVESKTNGNISTPEPTSPSVGGHIEVEIRGKVNTFSEAIDNAVHQAPPETQDGFIHKVLGDDAEITSENRNELLRHSVAKLSVSNLDGEFGKGVDVENLVYEGNKVVLKSDGSWEVLKGDGSYLPKAVPESELREAASNLKGAAKPEAGWEQGRAGSQGTVYYHEISVEDLPKESIGLNHAFKEVLVDYTPQGTTKDGIADYLELRDHDDHVVEVLALGKQDSAGAALDEAHRLAAEFDQTVGKVEDALKSSSGSLSLSEKSEIVRWVSSAHEGELPSLGEAELSRLRGLDGVLGELKGKGFSHVDLGLVEQYRTGDLGWHVSEQGNFVWDKAASPLTKHNIELPITKGSSFTKQSMDSFKAAANALLNQEQQAYERVHQVAGGETDKIMALRCNEANDDTLMSITRKKFLFFKADGGGRDLYQHFKKVLGADYLSDSEHTIGERLASASHKGINLDAPNGDRPAAILQEQVIPKSVDTNAATDKIDAPTIPEGKPQTAASNATELVRGKSSPEVIAEVKGEIVESQLAGKKGATGIAEHANDQFAEMDKAFTAYDLLHDSKATAAEKFMALRDLKLTDGGRSYMFKGGTEGIALKDGKFIYYDHGSAIELTYENIDSLARGSK